MTGNSLMKKAYNILRNLIMSVVIAVAGLYVLLYVVLSIPFVQTYIKNVAQSALSEKTGGKIEIGKLSISPFNQVVLSDVVVNAPDGSNVAIIEEVGGGLNIWRLVSEFRFEFTFAEIIGMDAHISQPAPDAPLNIQFLIDAFKSKDKNKPPTRFDLEINNIVIRQCSFTFDKEWIPRHNQANKLDFNHINVTNFAADLRIPVLKNEEFLVDLRRLSLKEKSGLTINSLSGEFHLTPDELDVNHLKLRMPGTSVAFNDMKVKLQGFDSLVASLKNAPLHLTFSNNVFTPSDFRAFVPALGKYSYPVVFSLDISRYDDIIDISQLSLNSDLGIRLDAKGVLTGLEKSFQSSTINLESLSCDVSSSALQLLLSDSGADGKLIDTMAKCGDISLNCSAKWSGSAAAFKGEVSTLIGRAVIDVAATGIAKDRAKIKGEITTDNLNLGVLTNNDDFGKLTAEADFDVEIKNKDINGYLNAVASEVEFKQYVYTDIYANLDKRGSNVEGEVSIDDENISFDISGIADISGKTYNADVDVELRELNLAALNLLKSDNAPNIKGNLNVVASGTGINNADIYASLTDFRYSDKKFESLQLNELTIDYKHTQSPHSLNVNCDFFEFEMDGEFYLNHIRDSFLSLMAQYIPEFVSPYSNYQHKEVGQNFDCKLTVYHDSELMKLLKLPVKLFEPLEITCQMDSRSGTISLLSDIPYLLQSKDKIIKNTHLSLDVDTATNLCNLNLSTCFTNNKGDIAVGLDANAANNVIDSDIFWIFDRPKSYTGNIKFSASAEKADAGSPLVRVDVHPSTFQVADTIWNVSNASIFYKDKSIKVSDLKVYRDNQFITVDGLSSPNPKDAIAIDLQHIDLDYIFEVLNINYVTFGGNATGRLYASNLLSSQPQLRTDSLSVERFTYNGALLGNALIKSYWNNKDQSVKILADVTEKNELRAKVDGDIWVTKDSLSFGFNANKINAAFMKPFVAAFSSDLEGRASGQLKLYGSFKDINLTGKAFADSLRMKIDVTNTYYSVSDSVFMTPGKILIPSATLYDRDGHTANLTGEIRHKYFHEPEFEFTISNAQDFLCYDTSAKDNTIWYGTIYGNGFGRLTGIPGFIDVSVDMTTAPHSSFTFVLDDKEEAVEYDFLTFTNKKKAAAEIKMSQQLVAADTVPDYIKKYLNKKNDSVDVPTRFKIDLRVTATPDGDMTIVMDPVAGDKIKAVGNGALRIGYNSEGDLSMYGTYTLDRGSYNFTLQDLIVRDFKIREGSKITFTGDPLDATLNIDAAYRLNTNLSDLDKSFASDRDLNRTNVPVEAILKVSGNMNHPDINFDIELPTLTQDVARKVKSIVSTSDMMNRQIIYLLALNRFYTPDYMSTSSNNNELASVASTTISTQLSSMLGQLSNNWSFMPNIRTDKGDFSDTEVDLALSSTLLNNRLLLNGNFGYRDKSTSTTSFIGDFDIEYLLNKTGSLRLKAYNHFNDQNYYLKSSLTTQGIGVVFKHDFDNLFNIFRRKEEQTDSVCPNP